MPSKPRRSVVRNWRIRFMLASLLLRGPAIADEVPTDLVRRVAIRESETAARSKAITLTASPSASMKSTSGGATVASIAKYATSSFRRQERTEQMAGKPTGYVDGAQLTDEDFRDIREVQPFLLTKEQAFPLRHQVSRRRKHDGYRVLGPADSSAADVQGSGSSTACFGSRKKDYSIIRSEGVAVPQIQTTKNENLVPAFHDDAEKGGGRFWFPVTTYGDDTLYFRSGPQRIG